MKVLGKHLILELKSCCSEKINDLNYVKNTLENVIEVANVTLLKSEFHQFAPQGVSGVLVIAESHISIHTWPEENYAAIDFFTCGDYSVFDDVIKYFSEKFEAKEYSTKILDRGI